MKKLTILLLAVAFTFCLNAQIQTPQPSTTAKLEQTVGLSTVKIEYSRPSLKGRTAFGTADEKSIEKYDAAWRTGANNATKLMFSEDTKINGKELKAGTYTILTKPSMKEWTVMFFTYETGGWTSYLEKEPVLETKVMAVKTGREVETFTIDINNITSKSATIDLIWSDFIVSIPMTVDTDTKVSNSITKVMNGPSQDDYYQAASYYQAEGKDLSQALVWIKQANAAEPKFWMVRREALILADLNRYEEAIAKAKMSKELAVKADYEPYIRNNEESIKEWTALLGTSKDKKSGATIKKVVPQKMKKSSSSN